MQCPNKLLSGNRVFILRLGEAVFAFPSHAPPSEMGGHETSQFLSLLVLDKNVAINTQKQALSALIFFINKS